MTKRMYTLRLNSLLVSVLLTVLIFAQNSVSSEKTITIKGSDTMVRLGQRWAEEFMHEHPEIVVQVSGGGSGTGFAALINGTTDIAQGSRDIKSKEVDALATKGMGVHRFRMALDGIAVFLHESNPLNELTLAQLRRVYIGEITNWKQLGGRDERIILYSRENNSGTYSYFKEAVLHEADFSPWTLTLPGTSAVVNAVAQDSLGIGYGGIAWAHGVKFCKIKATDSTEAFLPDFKLISDGIYPISRPLFWFTSLQPEGSIRDFVNWALSEHGQKIAEETHYVPLHPEDAASQIVK